MRQNKTFLALPSIFVFGRNAFSLRIRGKLERAGKNERGELEGEGKKEKEELKDEGKKEKSVSEVGGTLAEKQKRITK